MTPVPVVVLNRSSMHDHGLSPDLHWVIGVVDDSNQPAQVRPNICHVESIPTHTGHALQLHVTTLEL